jgi:SEC-C motif-containing protein
MRSRYAAYAKGLVDYVIATTEPGSPAADPDPAAFRRGIESFCHRTRFVGLDVLDAPEPVGDEGFVTFRAHLEQGGRPHTLEERSRFVRRDGVWRYHSGTPPR